MSTFTSKLNVSLPDASDKSTVLKKVKPLKDIADAVNVTDGARAKSHLSSLVVSSIARCHGAEYHSNS